jgi:hypothetical protein
MYRERIWSGGAVALFSVLLLAWVIPEYGGRGATFGMPPQLLPSIAAWVMLVASLVVVLQGVVGVARSRDPIVAEPPWEKIWGGLWPFLYVIGVIFVVSRVRITYAGPFIVGILLVLLGERRWYVILPCSVGPSVFLYLLSVYLMRIGVV